MVFGPISCKRRPCRLASYRASESWKGYHPFETCGALATLPMAVITPRRSPLPKDMRIALSPKITIRPASGTAPDAPPGPLARIAAASSSPSIRSLTPPSLSHSAKRSLKAHLTAPPSISSTVPSTRETSTTNSPELLTRLSTLTVALGLLAYLNIPDAWHSSISSFLENHTGYLREHFSRPADLCYVFWQRYATELKSVLATCLENPRTWPKDVMDLTWSLANAFIKELKDQTFENFLLFLGRLFSWFFWGPPTLDGDNGTIMRNGTINGTSVNSGEGGNLTETVCPGHTHSPPHSATGNVSNELGSYGGIAIALLVFVCHCFHIPERFLQTRKHKTVLMHPCRRWEKKQKKLNDALSVRMQDDNVNEYAPFEYRSHSPQEEKPTALQSLSLLIARACTVLATVLLCLRFSWLKIVLPLLALYKYMKDAKRPSSQEQPTALQFWSLTILRICTIMAGAELSLHFRWLLGMIPVGAMAVFWKVAFSAPEKTKKRNSTVFVEMHDDGVSDYSHSTYHDPETHDDGVSEYTHSDYHQTQDDDVSVYAPSSAYHYHSPEKQPTALQFWLLLIFRVCTVIAGAELASRYGGLFVVLPAVLAVGMFSKSVFAAPGNMVRGVKKTAAAASQGVLVRIEHALSRRRTGGVERGRR